VTQLPDGGQLGIRTAANTVNMTACLCAATLWVVEQLTHTFCLAEMMGVVANNYKLQSEVYALL